MTSTFFGSSFSAGLIFLSAFSINANSAEKYAPKILLTFLAKYS